VPPLRRAGSLALSAVLLVVLAACGSAPEMSPRPSAPGGSPLATEAQLGRWTPPAQVTWQWQLTGSLDLSVDAEVYDIDLFSTSADQVLQLHAQGRKVICYLDAGSFEPGRPDSAQYPAVLLGRELVGWPGEHWLDIRRLDLLLPLIAARMDLCAKKGFDGVEPDNVDGYANDTGFDLTGADQTQFNRELARLAHERGLAVGLKNDLDQVGVLQPVFDFAVNEQCVQYDECSQLLPFVQAGKPVLHVEYDMAPSVFCPPARSMGFSSMRKSLALDASRTAC
jgi:hypothetical protein